MFPNTQHKKIIGALLSFFVLVSILVPTHKAEAIFGIGDIVFDPTLFGLLEVTQPTIALSTAALVKKEYIIDTFVYAFLKVLIRSFTESIVSWIRTGGFQGGSLMIESFEEHFRQVIDNEAGIFLEKITSPEFVNLLCEPLRITLPQFAAGFSGSFSNRARCTITDIVENLENFEVQFSQGSWAAWDSLLEPNNNWMGLVLMTLDEKQRREAEAFFNAQKKVDTAGGGLVPSEDCDTTSLGHVVNCVTKTPGKIVAKAAEEVFNTNLDQLKIADEISEIIAAALNELISWAITGGGGGFSSESVKKTKLQDTTPPNVFIISPQNNDTVSGIITVSASATDSNGIAFVRFYVDGSEIQSQGPPYRAIIDTTTLSNGEHTISVLVGDNRGNVSESGVINVTVNNPVITPPPPPPPPPPAQP